MLTARARPEEVLEGIEAGADDYLAKPFDLNILLIRLKSLLRRTAWQNASTPETPPPAIVDQTDEYAFNHRTIRFDTLELIAPNRITHLTSWRPISFATSPAAKGQIVSRLSHPRGRLASPRRHRYPRQIDNFIVRLRRVHRKDDPATPSTSSPSAASVTASSLTPEATAAHPLPRLLPPPRLRWCKNPMHFA